MRYGKRGRVKVGLFAVGLFMITAFSVLAQDKGSGAFDPKQIYDVYSSTGDGQLSVIKNVKVLDPIKIQDGSVLVIVTTGLRKEKGFVQMRNVVAVLPAGQSVYNMYKPAVSSN